MFSHNGPHTPESKTTRMFRPVRQVAQQGRNLPSPMNCGRGLILLWRQCNKVCTSSFYNGIMVPHNGADGPESKTKRMFRWVDSTWGKVAVYNCRLITGPPTHSVGSQYRFARCRLLSSVVCHLSSSVTLHGGATLLTRDSTRRRASSVTPR